MVPAARSRNRSLRAINPTSLPLLSTTGRFDPKALDTLARMYVDLGLLDQPPDMSRLLTEAYLPGAAR